MMLDNGNKIPFGDHGLGCEHGHEGEDPMNQKVQPVPEEQAIAVAMADKLSEEFLIIISDCTMTGNTLSFSQMHKILAGMFRAYGDGMARGEMLHQITSKAATKEKPVTLRELQQSLSTSRKDNPDADTPAII